MPKRTSKLDVVQNAKRVFDEALIRTEESETTFSVTTISQVMAAMGRKGGKIGGKRRLVTMTPERRSEVGRLAALKRWGKRRKAKK